MIAEIDFSRVELKKKDVEVLRFLYLDPIYLTETDENIYFEVDSYCIMYCIANIFYKYPISRVDSEDQDVVCDCDTCKWDVVINGEKFLEKKYKGKFSNTFK